MLIRRTKPVVGFIGGLASIYGVAVFHIGLFTHTVEIPLYLILLALVALIGLGILFRKPLRRWISGTEFTPSDARSISDLIHNRHLLEKSSQVCLWLYTAETILNTCRDMLEKQDKEIEFKIYVRRPEYTTEKKQSNAEGALKTALEITTVNPKIQIKIHFYTSPPINRLQLFHMPKRSMAFVGVYHYDQGHPMQFIGAENNQMLVLDSQRPEEAPLLSAIDSQFQRLWDQSSGLRAVLFDMDGVLMDTMDLHYKSWEKALSKHLSLTDSTKFRREVYRLEGMGVQQTIQWFFKEYSSPLKNQALVNQIARDKERYHGNLVDNALPFDGMVELVSSLKERGIPLAIVSGASRDVVSQILQRYFPDLFSTIISGEDTKKGKPDAEPYTKAIKKLSIGDAEGCLVVENSPLGVASGKAAGARVIGILQGSPLLPEHLKINGAEEVFPGAKELENFLRRL